MKDTEGRNPGFDYWFENFCEKHPTLVPDDGVDGAKMKYIALSAFQAGEYEGCRDELGTRHPTAFDPIDFEDWFSRVLPEKEEK